MLSAIKLFTRFPRLSRGIYAKSKLLSGYDALKADRQNTYLYKSKYSLDDPSLTEEQKESN